MGRASANLILLLATAIWGCAFVAQQTAMASLGPFVFTGLRFALATLVVLPLAIGEARRGPEVRGAGLWLFLAVGLIFFAAGILQQVGLKHTSVTNAGFLTALYVVMVPFIALVLFRHAPHPVVWPAAAVSLAGTFLLAGGEVDALTRGDLLVVAGALFWALHVAFLGYAAMRTGRPLTLACAQFAVCAVLGLGFGVPLEGVGLAAVQGAWIELAYAGLVSGGIGFTLQAVAQRWTPPSDAAIILSGEALFAALAAAILLGERLVPSGWAGAGLIMAAILAVQLVPTVRRQRGAREAA